jgi:hypothetical protein
MLKIIIMKKLLSKLSSIVFGERVPGEYINLDPEFKPALWTSYPKELEKPPFNEWTSSLNVSSRVPKYSSTGSVIL